MTGERGGGGGRQALEREEERDDVTKTEAGDEIGKGRRRERADGRTGRQASERERWTCHLPKVFERSSEEEEGEEQETSLPSPAFLRSLSRSSMSLGFCL